MSTKFAAGERALGICDRCGLTYKLKTLKKLTINESLTNLKVCADCWEPGQPQLQVGRLRVVDSQALREPRPDTGQDASRQLYDADGNEV